MARTAYRVPALSARSDCRKRWVHTICSQCSNLFWTAALGSSGEGTPSRAGFRRPFGDAQGSCRVIIAVLRLAAAGQPEHEQLACNGNEILPADASAFGFPDQLAGCLGGVPQGSSHKEAILVDNLQLVDEAGKDALIQAVAAYPSMLFVLCCRCPLPGWLAEYELASRAHDRA